ncbi:hypothetical protein QN382_12810 [Pseudomonas sp. 10B1]|uniref:hypothetical protein n=1 Tax=unclassified Pseudomonas TaxID=196821 RepID=UPI002AB42040|nr:MULTISPECIES: hypothetical protein [unclassified Pseudomonas]MDY7559245.1 hypothetical protein [Pseudomonas sp. AB6]MEA9994161.1 hypothetical protein [Pseudomonas sp. AA4]MEB0086204.1 hypothetical protein [Pseudomonas sp. RTI1]MEB0124992.1 hypothetical protein [Pseudomonas sp. CCC1.2]MEB0153050.1 hypothetical protein [Pseudomonas sp. CCC4.3]
MNIILRLVSQVSLGSAASVKIDELKMQREMRPSDLINRWRRHRPTEHGVDTLAEDAALHTVDSAINDVERLVTIEDI